MNVFIIISIERNSYYSTVRNVFYPPPFTCNRTRLECLKGVKDEVKQARRAKRVAEGHQLEIGAQRAPRFLVLYILTSNLFTNKLNEKNIFLSMYMVIPFRPVHMKQDIVITC